MLHTAWQFNFLSFALNLSVLKFVPSSISQNKISQKKYTFFFLAIGGNFYFAAKISNQENGDIIRVSNDINEESVKKTLGPFLGKKM